MKLILFLIFTSTAKFKLSFGKSIQGKSIVTVNVSPNTAIVPSSTTTSTTVPSVNINGLSVFTFATPRNSTTISTSTSASIIPTSSSPLPLSPFPNSAIPEVTSLSPTLTTTTSNNTEPTSSIPTPPPNAPAVILTPAPNIQNNGTTARPQFSLTPPPDHESQLISNNMSSNSTSNSTREVEQPQIQINLTLANLKPSSTFTNKSLQINIQDSTFATPSARSTDATSMKTNNLEFENTTVEHNNNTDNPELVIITFLNFLFVQDENATDLFGSIEESTVQTISSTEEFEVEENDVISPPPEVQETEMTTLVITSGMTIMKSNKTTIRREEVTSYDEEYKEIKS